MDSYLHVSLYTLSVLVSYTLIVQQTQERFQATAVIFGLERRTTYRFFGLCHSFAM